MSRLGAHERACDVCTLSKPEVLVGGLRFVQCLHSSSRHQTVRYPLVWKRIAGARNRKRSYDKPRGNDAPSGIPRITASVGRSSRGGLGIFTLGFACVSGHPNGGLCSERNASFLGSPSLPGHSLSLVKRYENSKHGAWDKRPDEGDGLLEGSFGQASLSSVQRRVQSRLLTWVDRLTRQHLS